MDHQDTTDCAVHENGQTYQDIKYSQIMASWFMYWACWWTGEHVVHTNKVLKLFTRGSSTSDVNDNSVLHRHLTHHQ